MRCLDRLYTALPRRLQFFAQLHGRAKLAARILRHIKVAIVGPSEGSLRQAHFFDAERFAVRVPGVLLVGAPVSDVRTRHDERRSILDEPSRRQRHIHGRGILSVDSLHMPPVSLEAAADVFGEREVGCGGKRDQIRVVQDDQATEAKGAGERCRFRRDAFHHVSIAGKDVGVMVDDVDIRSVERRGEPPLGDRQSDAVADALAKWPGGDFDARRAPAFRMSRRFGCSTAGTA